MLTYKEISLTEDQEEEFLEEILTREHFLGHVAYEHTNDKYNPTLYQKLFNWHPEHFHEEEGVRPSIILGRRGSGKSSYLNNLSHKENVIAISLKSWEALEVIETQIHEILEGGRFLIEAEKVSEIWRLIFLTIATKEIAKYRISDENLKEIIKKFPVKDFAKITLPNLILDIMSIFRTKYLSKQNLNVDIVLQSMGIGCESLDRWETLISKAAKGIGKYIIIMIDNPEKLEPDDELLDASYSDQTRARRMAYTGLLTLLAHFNRGKVGLQIRYCVPAEQYSYLKERSNAILKDYANIRLLQWSSGDLLSSVAHRYMVCLQLHKNNRDEERYKELKEIKIYTREGAYKFFNTILTGSLVNDRNFEEDPVGYLLRHTQLLPRQLLVYLNCAIKMAILDDPTTDLTRLNCKYIKLAIKSRERFLAQEIIDSYQMAFPEGQAMFEKLINFPIICRLQEIQNYWTSYNAKGILKDAIVYPQVSSGFNRFFNFLIETGILGVAIKYSETNKYVNTEYEYTVPNKLTAQSEEVVAVHPIFSCITCKSSHEKLGRHTAIYPKGSSIDDIQTKHEIASKFLN
ncbi:hypothetical protein PVT68_14130 [Microbulbifer bruguierae]|uniref:ATP-binding protein n=1 Tax=Microbulbifer bruguierae TaxID=3029061 RepID=A0ABY8NEL6_9GAMM|nr:hypothetical protein [Microbulbifer bruguierae]WGL15903.1 hypothetical protein PVT68_14130 [Microbulbifer bruguierae]